MVADEKNEILSDVKTEILSDVKTEILSSEKTEIISISNTPQEGSSGMDKLEDFFAIKSKVGDGGMGIVYLAKDIRLNRYVAIKRLKSQFLVDAQIRKRFLHEAKAVASLNNANIVHIYFIGEDNDGPYFVMEYIEGAVANPDNPNQPNPPQTLEQYIATNGVMSVDEAIDFMVKVGGAVVAAHSSGVIHRDLKPTNILIDISCFPKIVDFGLARITHTDVAASSLTVKGDKFISLGYGAPEQEQDASTTDERADIYGLGGISYYILTGKNPRFFREDDLPENIRPVISKALATDREQRWPTAESFIAALIQCKSNSVVERPTVKTTWRCKWCDTINPLATRYCGSCGWDGGTVCPECGAPNHFGVMFCSTCGANCKEYERAQTALDEARSALASAQYERILTNNSKPLNFDPIGPNGRKLIEELNQIYIDAKKKKERRDELIEIISMEINAENYERAERFIGEFRSISASNEAYETELSEFSKLKQRRDLARVAKAFTLNDWEYGAKLLDTIKTSGGTANVVEQRRLESIYKKHQRRSHLRCYPIIGLSVLFVYILLLPIVAALLPSGFVRTAWYPANVIVKTLHLTDSVEQISQFMGGSVVAIFEKEQIKVETPKEAVAFQNYFDRRNEEFQLVYDEKVKTLEKEYIDVLETLSDQFKNELNMDAWMLVRNEKKRFQSNPKEIVLLNVNTEAAHRVISLQKAHILKRDTTLAGVYHEYLTAINKKLEALDASIKKLMHDSSVAKNGGNEKDSERLMDNAEAYYKIRNTVRQNSFYVSATAALKSFDEKYPNLAGSFYLGDSSGEKTSQIVIEKRKAFENQMSEFASQRKAKEQERASAYVVALDALLTKRKAAGDFDGVTIITKEQERFAQNQTIIVNSLSQDLNNLTREFVDRERMESNQIDKAILVYVDKYIAELDKLISDQTKANNLNIAAAIDSERKRVQILPEVVEIREQQN